MLKSTYLYNIRLKQVNGALDDIINRRGRGVPSKLKHGKGPMIKNQ